MTTTRTIASVSLVLALLATAAAAGDLNGRVKGGTAASVVWIQGAPASPVPAQDTVITHISGGAFDPSVSIGFVGREFVFRNEDDELHNTHLYLELAEQKKVSSQPLRNGATLYNIALPLSGMEVRRPIRPYHEFREQTGPITIRCNPHPGEEASLLVFGHPYAALSGSDGRFSIAGLPAGSHDLWVWNGGSAAKWGQVEVKSSGATDVVVDLASVTGVGQ
jgi:hypothetical protein